MRQCHIVLVYEGQSTLKLGYIRHLADTLQLKNLHKPNFRGISKRSNFIVKTETKTKSYRKM